MTPQAVRQRFSRFSTFHGEWGIDFGDLSVYDEGNWPVSPLDMHEMPERVRALAEDLPDTPLTLFLGGDNAITRPLVNSYGDPTRVGVITFDAHHDVRTLDLGPTNGTPIRGLIEGDGLPGAHVSQIGIHSFANSATYRQYCDDQYISVATVAEVEKAGIGFVVLGAIERLLARCDVIYVDVDLDVLDASVAPACPGARPGGLALRTLAEGVRLCASHPRVRAIDFVEVDAQADINGLTLDAMAHLVLAACAGFTEHI
jgi:formimidoylglutamase